MKKFFLLVVTIIALSAIGFSRNPVDVNNLVLQSFNKEFKSAQNIEWTETTEFVRAKFEIDAQVMYAYFTQNGQLMAITRNIDRDQLPIRLSQQLAGKYKQYYVADIFEVLRDGQTIYYVTVRNSITSVVLESVSGDDWRQYKKQKL